MSDAEYLILRAHQELKAAIRASDQRVRQVHLELADAYSLRLSEKRAQERRPKRVMLKEDRRAQGHQHEDSLIVHL